MGFRADLLGAFGRLRMLDLRDDRGRETLCPIATARI